MANVAFGKSSEELRQ